LRDIPAPKVTAAVAPMARVMIAKIEMFIERSFANRVRARSGVGEGSLTSIRYAVSEIRPG
jgi:hypothetical protein